MFSIGNDELDVLPEFDMNEKFHCRECGKMLSPVYGIDFGTGKAVVGVVYIYCDDCDTTYLVGLNGKKLNWED
jgi:hypothetical protein